MMSNIWKGSFLVLALVVFVALALTPPGSAQGADERSSATDGRLLFREQGCNKCHTIGGFEKTGPDLEGVATRYSPRMLVRWIVNPHEVYRAYHVDRMNPGYPEMPVVGVTEAQARKIAAYLGAPAEPDQN